MVAVMRIDQAICAHLDVTRSQAARLVRQKKIYLNGELCLDRGAKITAADHVVFEEQTFGIPQGRYMMLHKPKGYVCDRSNTHHTSVFALIPDHRKIHVAGRLDVDTTGLVLLTDDGAWSHRICAPKTKCPKRYRVTITQTLTPADIEHLEQGLFLKNEKRPCQHAHVKRLSEKTYHLTISEGKYHQVKRMFAALGHRVTALHREAIGELELDADLALGKWRMLRAEEVALLR